MTFSAAVIGCGRMGAFTSESVRRWSPACWLPLAHAEAIALHPELDLTALCDSSPDNLARARAAYGGAAFEDYRQLAREAPPRLACIATRTIGRAEIVRTLFEAGTRAFHIEKPLCNSMAELYALEAIFSRPDVFVTYGTVRRFFPIYRAARDLALSLEFGELLETRADFGPGTLYWVHPHTVDLILFAANGRKVTGIQARLGQIDPGEGIDQVANDPLVEAASIWFDDGSAGHIGRGPGLDFTFGCENGSVVVHSDGRSLQVAKSRGADPYPARDTIAQVPKGPGGTLAPLAQLASCLAGKSRAIAANVQTKADILMGSRVLFAMIDSHRRKSAIVEPDQINPLLEIIARAGCNFA